VGVEELAQATNGLSELGEASVRVGLLSQELLTVGDEELAQATNGFRQLREAAFSLRPKLSQLGGHAEDLLRGQQGPEDLPPLRVGL
jgi:hypothetical protein